MILNLLVALHVIFGAAWFGMAVSFRVRELPHRGFLAGQALAAVLAIALGLVLAALERPDMTSTFGRVVMTGAGLAILAVLLMGALVVWPTVAASRPAASLSAGARRRMIWTGRGVAVLLLTVLILMGACAPRLNGGAFERPGAPGIYILRSSRGL